jgi:hypothetical protein
MTATAAVTMQAEKAWKEWPVLMGMDEYPYHQITATFAGVAGTDPAWNDGHYICLSELAGAVGLASTLRGGTVRLIDADGVHREYAIEDLGWIYTQGGGYFGGFDDGLGQGVYRGDDQVEGEIWDISHPTLVVDAEGRSFEFDHAWAQNFTRLTCNGQRGLAHFECVVITQAQDWTVHPGRTDVGGPGE